MDLLEIHKRIRFSLNKDDTGYLLPSDIDNALDRAQLQELRHLYGDDRKLPDAPLAYGMTLKIHADLLPLKRETVYNADEFHPTTNALGTAPNGVLLLPSDFLFPISIVSSAGQVVKIISEDEIGIRLSSVLRPPTKSRPIAVFGGSEISNGVNVVSRVQLFPEIGNAVKFYYLKRPAKPYLSATISGRQLTYRASSSVQMEWSDTAIDRIIERTIAVLGEGMQETEIGRDNYQKAQV